MSVNYLEIVNALDCCVGLPADEDAEDLCNNCPYAEKGCDEGDMCFIAMPECLIADIRLFLAENASLFLQRPGRQLS